MNDSFIRHLIWEHLCPIVFAPWCIWAALRFPLHSTFASISTLVPPRMHPASAVYGANMQWLKTDELINWTRIVEQIFVPFSGKDFYEKFHYKFWMISILAIITFIGVGYFRENSRSLITSDFQVPTPRKALTLFLFSFSTLVPKLFSERYCCNFNKNHRLIVSYLQHCFTQRLALFMSSRIDAHSLRKNGRRSPLRFTGCYGSFVKHLSQH